MAQWRGMDRAMTKDRHIEDQKELFRAANNESIAHDAAVLIQRGYTESEALGKARQINENQQGRGRPDGCVCHAR